MAKRRSRPQADDAPAQPESQRPKSPALRGPSDTFAARAQAGDRPSAVSATEGPPGPISQELNEDDIRMRAYELYLERGGVHGADLDDWVRAEQELRRKNRLA